MYTINIKVFFLIFYDKMGKILMILLYVYTKILNPNICYSVLKLKFCLFCAFCIWLALFIFYKNLDISKDCEFQGRGENWTEYYVGPQSIINRLLMLAQKFWVLLLNLNWLVQTSSILNFQPINTMYIGLLSYPLRSMVNLVFHV